MLTSEGLSDKEHYSYNTELYHHDFYMLFVSQSQ